MIQRVVPLLLGCLAFALPASAKENVKTAAAGETITAPELDATGAVDVSRALSLARPDVFSSVEGSVLIHSLPVLALLDGRRFPISSELGRMGATSLDVVPLAFLQAVEVQKANPRQAAGNDAPGGVVDLQLKRGYEFGGEVGFFYGKSSGKYGREDYEGHIIGGVGNEKFNLTVGASYRESSGRIPRGR